MPRDRADAWRRAYAALYDHAEFIFSNPENKYEVTSNHFLSNVVGLHVLAAVFADIREGTGWDAWCRQALETEIDVQVHEEGADFESSVPYHRLVTELFMASARLARQQGRPLSAHYEDEARPHGRVLTRYRATGRADAGDRRLRRWALPHLHLCRRMEAGRTRGICGARGGAAQPAGMGGARRITRRVGGSWWGYDPAPMLEVGCRGAAAGRSAVSRGRYRGGAVRWELSCHHQRRGGNRGFGNHKHNELLSFEYHCDGAPVIVDPGSFCYTSDFAARNLFRGTAYHNTIVVDGVEQNETNPEWIFRMFEKANPEHLGFAEDGDWIEYRVVITVMSA